MELLDIKEKAVNGLKWTFLISGGSVPLVYLTNVILGRVGVDALGTYALMQVFISTVSTFVLFGGNTLIVKMLPQVEDRLKGRFLLSYFVMVFAVGFVFLVLLTIFPELVNFFWDQQVMGSTWLVLFVLLPLLLLKEISVYSLNGLMEMEHSVVIQRLLSIGAFFLYLIAFLLFRPAFESYAPSIIIGVTIILVGLSTVLGVSWAYRAITEKITMDSSQLYFPQGFWSFAFFVQATSWLFFAYSRIDQIFIFKRFNLDQLGLYQSSLQMFTLVRLVPELVSRVTLPTFSNLIAAGEEGALKRGYEKLIKYIVLFATPVAFAVILLARPLLLIFGEEFLSAEKAFVVLMMGAGIAMAGQVNATLVLALGKARLYLLNSVVQIALQLTIVFLTITPLGITGAAIGRVVGMMAAQIGLLLILHRALKETLSVPETYFGSIVAILLIGAVQYSDTQLALPISLGVVALWGTFIALYDDHSIHKIRSDFVELLGNRL